MLKQVDLRPNHALDRKELIKKVYDLSEEVERLQKKITTLKKKPSAVRTVYIEKIREVKTLKVIEKPIFDSYESDLDFVVYLTGLSKGYIKDKQKKTEQVIARSIYYYILRAQGYSLKKIGQLIGGKDHATVINGLQKYSEIVSDNLQQQVDDYLKKMYNL